jgi:hypothetical protein
MWSPKRKVMIQCSRKIPYVESHVYLIMPICKVNVNIKEINWITCPAFSMNQKETCEIQVVA